MDHGAEAYGIALHRYRPCSQHEVRVAHVRGVGRRRGVRVGRWPCVHHDVLAKASGVGEGQSLAYQWQVQLAGTWTNLPGQTGERTHLSLANLEAGEYSLRCVVTATAPGGKSKTIESSEVTLALSPATPSGLDVREATRDTATLAWTWAGPGTVDSFNVRYREEGATDLDWVAVRKRSILRA